MEALTIVVLSVLLPYARAQINGLGADFSSGSLVAIGLVGALPLAVIIIIWTFFFYCICKNEYDYRKIYKELDKKENYLKRRQQRIKHVQLNTNDYHPAPLQFNRHTKDQHKAHSSTNIPLSALGRNDHERGGGGGGRGRLPLDPSRSKEPVIARLPPHIGYRNLTEELKQQQQRNNWVSNASDPSRGHTGPTAGPSHGVNSHRGHAPHGSSPFSFQHVSSGRAYVGNLPARDYPQSKTSAQPSNSSAFGQLSTWPQFN